MLKHLVNYENYDVFLNEQSPEGWKDQYEIHRRLPTGGTIKEGTVSSYPAALQVIRELNFALEHFTKALAGSVTYDEAGRTVNAGEAIDFIDLLAESDDDRPH